MRSHRPAFFVFILFLVSCQAAQPAPTAIPTLAPTNTSVPLPTSTNTPEPTFTPEPSPTPILLPDVIHQTFSGVSIAYRESFDFTVNSSLPDGWKCDDKSAAAVTTDGQLEIKPKDTGDWSAAVLYFSKERMTPNKAAYFTFMYTGDQEGFTLGFDAIREDGQLIKSDQKGFYSVALQLINGEGLSAHIIQDTFKGDGYFKGDLKLQENTWYDIVLGFQRSGELHHQDLGPQ